MTCRFSIPGCPVPWERTGYNRKTAVFFTRPRTSAYQEKVQLCARIAGVKRIDGRVTLEATFFLPTERRVDLDNLVKSIKDALNGIAWNDDSQVFTHRTQKVIHRFDPHTEVTIYGQPPEEKPK